MAKRNPLIVGLDVGTFKIGVVVAEVTETGVEVIGIGTAPSSGLRKGVVVNIDATVQAIASARQGSRADGRLRDPQRLRQRRRRVTSRASTATAWWRSRAARSAAGDVERVLDAARAVALPMDQEVLHVLPQEFVVDDQDGIKEPVGMSGVRLEARVHIVTTAISSAQNVIKCCKRAGLHVRDVLAPLAAAEAVLTPEERELGVAVVDIGAGTTDLAVVHDGAVQHTAVLPVGGNHVTSDIAAGLRTPFAEAELLKQRFGSALAATASAEETIEVPGLGGRRAARLSRRMLAEIIEPRVEEIFALAKKELERAGCGPLLTSGIVLTGGGSVLSGMRDLAERVFRAPVRLGVPLRLSGLVDVVASPMYATAVGLVLHG